MDDDEPAHHADGHPDPHSDAASTAHPGMLAWVWRRRKRDARRHDACDTSGTSASRSTRVRVSRQAPSASRGRRTRSWLEA